MKKLSFLSLSIILSVSTVYAGKKSKKIILKQSSPVHSLHKDIWTVIADQFEPHEGVLFLSKMSKTSKDFRKLFNSKPKSTKKTTKALTCIQQYAASKKLTGLDIAVRSRNTEVIKTLLKKKVSKDQKEKTRKHAKNFTTFNLLKTKQKDLAEEWMSRQDFILKYVKTVSLEEFIDEIEQTTFWRRPKQISDLNVKEIWFAASQHGRIDIMKYLLTKKRKLITINLCDGSGQNSLMKAVLSNQFIVCKFLLGNEININKKDNLGQTALMLAASRGKQELVTLLLQHKANKKLKNKEGKTAYQLAKEAGHKNVARLLR